MKLLESLFEVLCEGTGSDLHLRLGVKPRYRIDGELVELQDQTEVMTYDDITGILEVLLTPDQRKSLEQMNELDVAHSYRDIRLRVNCFQDYWGPALAMRRIPEEIPTLEDLHLPESLESFAHLRSGLVLITGATGSGKSSTLAALIDIINCSYPRHIVILEDPIEYVHRSKESVVHQRGMHVDFATYHEGLREALRQDPDVLLVGELRDLDSIRLALSAAEMGMLVYSTLHTLGTAQSVDRIYDVFPAEEQGAIRTLLSQALQGVVSQVLLKRMDGPGRLPATEVLVCSSGIRNLIREGKTHEITNYIQSGKSHGMHTLDESLEKLVRRRVVDMQEALAYAARPDRLEKAARRG